MSLYGNSLAVTFTELLREAISKGGRAEDWHEAYTMLRGIHRFLIFSKTLGAHDSIAMANHLGQLQTLAEDEGFRATFMEAMKP